MAPVGTSPPRAPEHDVPPMDASAPPPQVPSVVGEAMQQVSGRFISEGHGERFAVTVWANAAARERLDAGAPWPEGAAFAERATEPDADRLAGWLVMKKAGGVWRFSVVGAEAPSAGDAGAPACAACHRDADDGVFRWEPPAK